MNSDKNNVSLEKQLKTIGQKIRIDILKNLNSTIMPVPFSSLQKEILDDRHNSTNFSFHLNSLKKMDLVASETEGWKLTTLGRKILKHILLIEQVIVEQEKSLMVRTSKYSKEPFNINKIENYLILEGKMEANEARNIARDVKTRLFKSNIEYLTAPLIREYINGVLLERGFEQIRHRLTRLGTPPHDIKRFLALNQNSITTENVLKNLGSDVSEQFLLLNLLPNDLADSYISGEIVLLHLNAWWLRPLSLVVNTESILKSLAGDKLVTQVQGVDHTKIMSMITGFVEVLNGFLPFYSGDLLISNFSEMYFSTFNSIIKENRLCYFDLFFRQIRLLEGNFSLNDPRLLFDFSAEQLDISIHEDIKAFDTFLKYAERHYPSKSYVTCDYSKMDASIVKQLMRENIVFYNKKLTNAINSYIVNINNPTDSKENGIILDKVLLNFPLIAREASQNDNKFIDLILEKLEVVFKIFEHKKKLIKKSLNANKIWNLLLENHFNYEKEKWIDQSIKSVSFFGLNEAINLHCGIEMDRNENSAKFALNILELMKNVIQEKNNSEGENFILGQPHRGKYLESNNTNEINSNNVINPGYSARIIRENSKLPLSQKIKIFEKFQSILNGGVLLNHRMKKDDNDIKKDIQMLLDANLNAFSLNGNMT
ncbi:MAG: hypothetical protein JW891_08470 [Candidatus Lokiarchaeota archaeon]|nr:hypothetical protein [Candidatus Lokiarchaeota archaeon]